ncbi:ribokinase [Metabacillus idriensis]|uniref:ribokinase n=1 Tax=Metabacillus idriensis TaxID=324768 RepID=UPI00174C9A7D|nr:ribokinase [Metabacillus idriensis]
MNKIAVVGSLNIDLVAVTDVSPKMGETVIGKDFSMYPGGKGANQAVAGARLGGDIEIFGTIGDDQHGHMLERQLKNDRVSTSSLQKRSDVPTGCALIEICNAHNRIIVVPGANGKTDEAYLKSSMNAILNADVILLSMEIPLPSIEYLVEELYEHNKTIVLNPAPAVHLSEELMSKVTYLLPNEYEAEIIFGGTLSEDAALKRYPNKLLITKGEKGVTFFNEEEIETIPSIIVNPVDTTGAGDTFAGAFSYAISDGLPVKEAIRFAAIAAGLSVEKKGAQSGMPTLAECNEYRKKVSDDEA